MFTLNRKNILFNTKNQEKILRGYLPSGKIYSQIYNKDSTFSKVFDWISSIFSYLIEKLNSNLAGLFICQSKSLLKEHMQDYSMPNDIFFKSNALNNAKDIFVQKYLMTANLRWNFQAIANIYDADVLIYDSSEERPGDVEELKSFRFPQSFPLRFGQITQEHHDNTLYILLLTDEQRFPLKFPIKFGAALKSKIQKIYQIIKPSQIKIEYLDIPYRITEREETTYLPAKLQLYLFKRNIKEKTYVDVELPKRIEFCENLYKQ